MLQPFMAHQTPKLDLEVRSSYTTDLRRRLTGYLSVHPYAGSLNNLAVNSTE